MVYILATDAGVRKFINQSKRNSIDKSKIIKFLKESKNKILFEESNEIDEKYIKNGSLSFMWKTFMQKIFLIYTIIM